MAVSNPEQCVAIIPARGGSKRIPRKNIRAFSGQPMIAYSILAAKESGIFKRNVVSTDDAEIAAVAKRFGAEVPFLRPAELSNDHAGTDAVIQHALKWFDNAGQHYDYACCVYATAPFVQARYIQEGLEILKTKKAVTAFSVTSFPYPIFRSLKTLADGRVALFWPEYFATRSQDLPEAFHDAGQFYWMDIKKYLVVGKLFNDQSYPIPIPRYLVQDIDTTEDWETAERMYAALDVSSRENRSDSTK